MAQEIRYRKDPETGEVLYGEHTLNNVTTLHCVADLYEDGTFIARRRLTDIPLVDDEAIRNAIAQEAFKDFKPGATPEAKPTRPVILRPDTAQWSSTLAKALVE